MAAYFGKKLVLPIGCSCIAQMQLQSSPRRLPADPIAHFFDWVGVSAESTVEILNRRRPFVRSADDLELINGRVRAKNVRRVHFWHINEFFRIPPSQKISSLTDNPEGMRRFLDHHRFVMEQLDRPVDEVHCLWTNVQPNLRHAAKEVGEPWSDFILTSERYAALKESCSRLNARKVHVWFVCRREDVDASLVERPDVTLLDVPQSPTDFRGEIGLFDPVFEKMGICRPATGSPVARSAAPAGGRDSA